MYFSNTTPVTESLFNKCRFINKMSVKSVPNFLTVLDDSDYMVPK